MGEVTPEMLEKWRALCDAATPGPWSALGYLVGTDEPYGDNGKPLIGYMEESPAGCCNAEFIATARTAMPQLLDEVEHEVRIQVRLAEENAAKDQRIAELHAEVERLNQWADGFSDRQLEERRQAEARIKEMAAELANAQAEVEQLRYRLAQAHDHADTLFKTGHIDDFHEGGCPEDDTCECEWIGDINALFAALKGRG